MSATVGQLRGIHFVILSEAKDPLHERDRRQIAGILRFAQDDTDVQ